MDFPTGTKFFVGVPKEPPRADLVAAVRAGAASIVGVKEAYLPMLFVPSHMKEASLAVWLIVTSEAIETDAVRALAEQLDRDLDAELDVMLVAKVAEHKVSTAIRNLAKCKVY
jgi:hypothetical protein